MNAQKRFSSWNKAILQVTGLLVTVTLLAGCATGPLISPAPPTRPVVQSTLTAAPTAAPTLVPTLQNTATQVATPTLLPSATPTATATQLPLPSVQDLNTQFNREVKPLVDQLTTARENTAVSIEPDTPIIYIPANARLYYVQSILSLNRLPAAADEKTVYILYDYTRGNDLGYKNGFTLYISAETQEITSNLRLIVAENGKFSLVDRVKATGGEGSASLQALVEAAFKPLDKLPGSGAAALSDLEQIVGYACGIDMAPGLDYQRKVALLNFALSAANWAERRQAAQALGALTPLPLSSAPALIPILANNSLDEFAAQQTLSKMAADPQVLNLLIAALKDPAVGIRQHAATALRSLDSKPPALLEPFLVLLHDKDLMVRQEAATGLEVFSDPAVAPAVVPALIADLADEVPEVRQAAAQVLKEYAAQAAAAVPGLTGLLKDAAPDVRNAAARTLGAIGDPAKPALPELNKAAGGESNTDAFNSELFSIAALSSKAESLPVLRQALKSSSSQIRMAACSVLSGYQGVPGSIDLLVLALNDPDSYVRRNAYWALAELKGEATAALPTLTQIAQKTTDYQEYENVLAAIGAISGKAETLPLLKQALEGSNQPVRRAACNVLSGYTDVPGAEEVLRTILNDPDETVRQCAAGALASVSSQPAASMDALAQTALKETDPQLFYTEIASMMDLFGKAATLPTLAGAISSSQAKIKAMACSILAAYYLDVPGAAETMIPLPTDADASVRTAAARALKSFGSHAAAALDGLKSAAGKESDGQAYEAEITAIAAIASPAEAYPLIQATLASSQGGMRKFAAAALKACKGVPGAIDLLISLMHDADEDVRSNAVDSIGYYGSDGKKAVPDLINALGNPQDYYVYIGAATALGGIGADAGPAVPALVHMVQTAGDLEKVYPLGALEKIGTAARAAVPALMQFLNNIPQGNWSTELQTDCLKALGAITQEDFGTDIQKWNDWWKLNQKTW